MTITQKDWSMFGKGKSDQTRHKEKVKAAIKGNLADIVSEESLILDSVEKPVVMNLRDLHEPKIRFGKKQSRIGMGEGEAKVGDIVSEIPFDFFTGMTPDKGKNGSTGAGNAPGVDWYEADVNIEDIEELIFANLELPNRKQKEEMAVVDEDVEFSRIEKVGLRGNADKRRTLLQTLKRNSSNGTSSFDGTALEDVRYRTWDTIEKPSNNAVILAMMDTSGSMGQFEKYISRAFFFWAKRFLEKKYESVEIVYIAHHTEAKVVTEHEFFHKGESGGTICSSAYRLALDLIEKKYPPSRYNLYSFHVSDGDNLTSDNPSMVKLLEKMMEKVNFHGYLEVNQYNRSSGLMNAFKDVKNEWFKWFITHEKSDVLNALRYFFAKEV